MGIIQHKAIVVTSWSDEKIQVAHAKAAEILGELVSPLVKSTVNFYTSFFVGPSGSKVRWNESERHDERVGEFVAWLNEQRYEDSSSWLQWAVVSYGELPTEIEASHEDAHHLRP